MWQAPEHLKKGDTIGIVSTARKISLEELSVAIHVFEGWGLNVKIGKTIGAEFHQFAGEDKLRATDFNEMLSDNSVKAIICARGGYGTARVIEQIDFSYLKRNPKWICGFSDVTVLHNALHNVGIQSIHSVMPVQAPTTTPSSLESLRKALFGEPLNYEWNHHSLNKIGKAESVIVGGNLSIIYSLGGTKYDISTKEKILFFEDLDEYLYHIDRMMYNLKLSDKLTQLKALVVGGMNDMNDNKIPFGFDAEVIISLACKEYNFPISFGFPAGHISENNAIIFGSKVQLEVNSENSKLRFI